MVKKVNNYVMKMLWAILMLSASVSLADPEKAIQSDFADMGIKSQSLKVYQNNQKTFAVTLRNNGIAINGTGYTPFFWLYTNQYAGYVTTGSCAWTSISNGIYNSTFNPTQLATTGLYFYAIGVSTSALHTISEQGYCEIIADPNGR
jgi:hypothetical protein